MRGGEAGRVAARVRALLGDSGGEPAPESPGAAAPGRWQRLAARVPVRLDPGRRAALAVGLAVLVAAIGTGLWLVAQRPHSVAISAGGTPVSSATPLVLPGTGSPADSTSAAAASAPTSAAALVVDVAGKVRRPGLYELPPGSRVDDAVRAAGGALAGTSLTSLNLAARVADGQQIVVGLAAVPGGVVAAAGSGAAAGGSSAGPVSLNTATLEQLETLPGVGPVLAQHILDWRAAHGRFDSVGQLNDVPGIGDVKFAALRSLVTL